MNNSIYMRKKHWRVIFLWCLLGKKHTIMRLNKSTYTTTTVFSWSRRRNIKTGMVAMPRGCLVHNNNNPFELLILPQILSRHAAVTNIWVFSCWDSTICQGDALHLSPWQTRVRRREDVLRRGRRNDRGRGDKTASNPLKYFLNPLSSTQPDKQHILQPPPKKRGLCNQSSLFVWQLAVHTGSQLGWKERETETGRETEREGERDTLAFSVTVEKKRPKLRWWLPVTLTGGSSTSEQQHE